MPCRGDQAGEAGTVDDVAVRRFDENVANPVCAAVETEHARQLAADLVSLVEQALVALRVLDRLPPGLSGGCRWAQGLTAELAMLEPGGVADDAQEPAKARRIGAAVFRMVDRRGVRFFRHLGLGLLVTQCVLHTHIRRMPGSASMTWTVGTDVLAGRVVAAARRELGLSARALADRCGMPFGQLNKLETGLLMPSVAHLVALEEALRRAGMPGDRGVLLARIAEAEDRLRGTGAVVTRGRTDRDALGSPLREFVDRGLAAGPGGRAVEPLLVAEPGGVAYRAQLEGVGPLLKRLRTTCGLTQAALSERSGVWRSLLSMLETGDRRRASTSSALWSRCSLSSGS